MRDEIDESLGAQSSDRQLTSICQNRLQPTPWLNQVMSYVASLQGWLRVDRAQCQVFVIYETLQTAYSGYLADCRYLGNRCT